MPLYNVNMNISESGKIVELITGDGRTFAQLYCEGPLVIAAYRAINRLPIEKGKVNIYRGDIQMLGPSERLDLVNEAIVDTDDKVVESIERD